MASLITGAMLTFAAPEVRATLTPSLVLTPNNGPSGTIVTMNGSGFNSSDGGLPCSSVASIPSNIVLLPSCNIDSSGKLVSGSVFTVISPVMPGAYFVTVTGYTGDAASATFTVTGPILTLTPNSGPSGTIVTMNGSGFNSGDGGLPCSDVVSSPSSIVGLTLCHINTSGQIVRESSFWVTYPVTPGAYVVTVTGSTGDFASAVFTVTGPTLTLEPNNGHGGTTVTMTGSGFNTDDSAAPCTALSAPVNIVTALTCTITSSGQLAVSRFTINGTATSGIYYVTVTGYTDDFATTTFNVSSAEQSSQSLSTSTQTTSISSAWFSSQTLFEIVSVLAAVVTILAFVASIIRYILNRKKKRDYKGQKFRFHGPSQPFRPKQVQPDSLALDTKKSDYDNRIMSSSSSDKKFRVFIAYDDATGLDLAEHLKLTLEKRNISSFVAAKDIAGYTKLNQGWRDKINHVIESCNTFITILSSIRLSPEVKRETMLAFERNKSDAKLSIIIAHLKGTSRTDQELLSAGLDSSAYQQVEYSTKHELARQISVMLDDQGFTTTFPRTSKEQEPTDDALKQLSSVLKRMKTRWQNYLDNGPDKKWNPETIKEIKTKFGEDGEDMLRIVSDHESEIDSSIIAETKTVIQRIGLFRSFNIDFALRPAENAENFSNLEHKGNEIFKIIDPLLANLQKKD